MMIKRILTICAALAAGAAGTSMGISVALAQGYSQPSGPLYSAAPAPYPPGGYIVDERRAPGAPDFDALDDDDDAPNAQSSTALSPPGPVLSPADPRYGRPDSRPVYSDRAPGPILSPSDPRYGRPDGPPPVIYSDRPAGPPQQTYSDRGNDDPRALRPPGGIGEPQGLNPQGVTGTVQPGAPQGADGRPLVLSALPPEEQPEVGPAQLPPHLRKQEVAYATKEPAGTLVVDTPNTHLYYILGNGRAIRYGVRVGRDGFTWNGVQKVSRKAEWPDWHPPTEMIERQPYLPRFMAGGPGNPMGARAMYLGSTVFRIHGTNQPSTIGKFVSSGCIGMLNEDVSDLFDRVKVGTRVVVLPGGAPPASTATASAQPLPAAGPGPAQAYNAPVPGQQPTVVPPLPAPVTVR
ncbi:MAG: L,D-transpeptidase family protein [Bradyrhizobium sp.]|uniref:L,D-transpeptidase n=1 Tax=Bradyrhizobium sp. TaxID=376 RepID=UPI00271C60DD|nr:L,D-transpeptidase family protein [Bradyrhizobium sp.]MDO8396225.1 L,D-transpeptidase family protein [Bradyrhizobium sp.]